MASAVTHTPLETPFRPMPSLAQMTSLSELRELAYHPAVSRSVAHRRGAARTSMRRSTRPRPVAVGGGGGRVGGLCELGTVEGGAHVYAGTSDVLEEQPVGITILTHCLYLVYLPLEPYFYDFATRLSSREDLPGRRFGLVTIGVGQKPRFASRSSFAIRRPSHDRGRGGSRSASAQRQRSPTGQPFAGARQNWAASRPTITSPYAASSSR